MQITYGRIDVTNWIIHRLWDINVATNHRFNAFAPIVCDIVWSTWGVMNVRVNPALKCVQFYCLLLFFFILQAISVTPVSFPMSLNFVLCIKQMIECFKIITEKNVGF